jgi:hypothetical protein
VAFRCCSSSAHSNSLIRRAKTVWPAKAVTNKQAAPRRFRESLRII